MTPDCLTRMAAEFEAQWRLDFQMGKSGGVSTVPGSQCDPVSRDLRLGRYSVYRAGGDKAHARNPRHDRWCGLGRSAQLARVALAFTYGAMGSRSGPYDPGRPHSYAEHRAAGIVSLHRDQDGRLLDVGVAAVELLNLLRPAVAIDHYIVFAAMALHDRELKAFVRGAQIMPVFSSCWRAGPAGIRMARSPVREGGVGLCSTFLARTVIHMSGRTRRYFYDDVVNPFNLIPQGGGEYLEGHRCAGEGMTIEVMKAALRMLTTAMSYEVPPQDFSTSLLRMPAVPKSRFVITKVRQLN